MATMALRLALAAAAAGAGAAYETWHVVDVPAVICPNRTGGSGASSPVNLAKGKATTCVAGMTGCIGVTDGGGACSVSAARVARYNCTIPANVTVDLGSAMMIDEVVLFQDSCNSASYCGHRVEISVDGKIWTEVYTAPTLGYDVMADPRGASMRFNSASARYVRVYSSRSDKSPMVYFNEVEVYSGRALPPVPEFEIGIPMNTQLDPESPYVISFIRASTKETTISYELIDAMNKTIHKDTVKLQGSTNTIPDTCKCTGAKLPSAADRSMYGAVYGASCGNWDEAKCDKFWPELPLGDWCCTKWCYADPSCPDSYQSSLIPGGYFSYSACAAPAPAPKVCKWTVAAKDQDPCKCRNVASLMDARMKSLFPSDYGSSCGAWDSKTCEANYRADQVDDWCCKAWCYVAPECPNAQPSLNPGMEDKLSWADKDCEQDAQFIVQCPYQKSANITEENLDACVCLNEKVPTALLPTGAPANYGSQCAPHDAQKCEVWYPNIKTGMWCCSSWCYVSPTCPDAKASTLWQGHYWSSLTCDWDPDAAVDCKYSTACKCLGSNAGVNTTKFGVNYGRSCGAWDSSNCAGFWNGTVFWQNDSRNDWCCDEWCYVNESCPLAADDSNISMMKFSSQACNGTSQSAGTTNKTAYAASSNTCVAPESCACLASVPAAWQPVDGYGATCVAHDAATGATTCGGRGIECCLPWCYVSDACPYSVPSPRYPGAFVSYTTCEAQLDRTTLVSCPHSTACKCANNNTGVDTTRFPTTYGKDCGAHDAAKCYDWWGPASGAGLWNTSAGGNDWCCDSWCYVAEDCPLQDGMGEAVLPYSYRSCVDSTQVYNTTSLACEGTRRLTAAEQQEEKQEEKQEETQEETQEEKQEKAEKQEKEEKEEKEEEEESADDDEEAEEVGEEEPQDEEGDSDLCEQFFLFDGRPPVELPDTWEEARLAVGEVCEGEGYYANSCEEAALLAFQGFPEGGETFRTDSDRSVDLCSRLVFLGAAASASKLAVASVSPEAAKSVPMHLVDPIRAALHRRASPPETPEAQQHMDETFAQKAAAWAEVGGVVGAELPARLLKASQGGRRLKSTTGGSTWGSGSTSVPVARRRTPARPAAAAARRRASSTPAAAAPVPAGLQRRRTQSFTTHRRRAKDIDNKQRKTATGQSYGYTSQPHLYQRFNGHPPSHSPYGYSAPAVYPKQSRKSVAMYALAGGAAGVATGVGAYYAYTHLYGHQGIEFRRRRTAPPSWCIAPPAAPTDMMECSDCYARYGTCQSAADCYEAGGSGCGMQTKRDYGKDDLMDSGFVPSKWTAPFRVIIRNVSGPDIRKSDICPPTTEAEAALAATFNRSTGFDLDLFLTLTQLEELDPRASTGLAAALATSRAALGRVAMGLAVVAALATALGM